MLARDVGSTAVNRFEHGIIRTDIHGRQKTEAANKAACQIGNNITV